MKASGKKGVEMENIWCAGGPSFLPIDSISPHLLEHLGLMHHVDLDPNYSLPLFMFLILSLSEIYTRWSALGLKKCDVASFHLDDPHLNPSKCYFGRVRVFFFPHLSSCQSYRSTFGKTSPTGWRQAASASTRRGANLSPSLPTWLWCLRR